MTYDDMGRLSTRTDEQGNVTKYKYDFKGQVVQVINALNQGVAMEYDGSGNVVRTTELGELNADGSDKDPSDNLVTAMAYDFNGRKVSVKDAAGNETKYEYTGADCGCSSKSASAPAMVTDPLGNNTVNTFDKNGRVIAVADPMNHTSAIAYDQAGRVKSRTDANGKTTTYAYDAVGRLLSQTDPAGGLRITRMTLVVCLRI